MSLNRLKCFSSQSIDLEQKNRKLFTKHKYRRRPNDDRETKEVEHPIQADKRILEIKTGKKDIDERVVPPSSIDSKLMRNGYFQ